MSTNDTQLKLIESVNNVCLKLQEQNNTNTTLNANNNKVLEKINSNVIEQASVVLTKIDKQMTYNGS